MQVWQAVAEVQVAHPEGHRVHLLLAMKVPAGQLRQVVTEVGSQTEQPTMHWVQESLLTRVKPMLQPPTSQALAPTVSQLMQFLAQAEQTPLTGVKPGLHLTQNW